MIRCEILLDKTQVMVYFKLYAEDFPLEIVTERLGVNPTKIYKKGEIIRRISETETHTRSYSSWELSTGYQDSLDVGELLEQVIRQIRNKTSIINELKKEFGLECRFVIVAIMENGYTPALYLDIPVIEFANSIKADFDIDLYANPYVEEAED